MESLGFQEFLLFEKSWILVLEAFMFFEIQKVWEVRKNMSLNENAEGTVWYVEFFKNFNTRSLVQKAYEPLLRDYEYSCTVIDLSVKNIR